MSNYLKITYSAVVNTTIALPSVLAFHDLSEEMWDSLKPKDHRELIATYIEKSGLGKGVRIKSIAQVEPCERTNWQLSETIRSAVAKAAQDIQATESEVIEEILTDWVGA